MPRNGLGMPISASQSQAAPVVIDDVLWEDFGGSGGEIAVNYQETRTNVVLYSQDVTDAEAWTKGNTAIESTLYEAPDNSTTANAIKSNSTGEKVYNINQNLSVTAGKTYTLSAHVKKENLGFVQLRFSDDDGLPRAQFNLTTGAITNASNTIRTQVDSMDDGWFRCSITFVATTSSGSAMVMAQSADGDATPNIAVSGIVLIYVWGFQLEESIEATSYIVTTTEARTATTTLNDTSDVWDFDGADLMPEADPDSEGVWEEGNNLVLNGDYEDLGSEEITNGNFSNGETNWANIDNLATFENSSVIFLNDAKIYQNVTSASSLIYKIVIDFSSISGDGVEILVGNGNSFINYSVSDIVNNNNQIVAYSNFIGSGLLFIYSQSANTNATITNVSVKQVDPNDRWSLGTGWSIEDGKLKATSTDAEATQASIFTPGNSYEITFTIDSIASGSVRVKAGTSAGSTRTSAGTYTQVFDVLFGTSLAFDMVSSGTCVIDNVTVREYAIQPQDV